MFNKKTHIDVKKLTSKVQDSKKDTASRLRHLKTILEHVDIDEAKSFFESNYSHVYFILYDTFVQAETNLRQRVHKAHREELEGSLWLLGKILNLLPELIARRWQCHSLGRVMAKLLHHGNSSKLRREGVRFFLLWYQTLCENAPPHVHAMYTELIPGLIVPQKGQIGLSETEFAASDLMNHPNMKVLEAGTSVFHDTGAHPVRPPDATPLLPLASNERTTAPDPRDGLEVLLDGMLKATGGLRWRDNAPQRHMRSFAFLLQRFKEVYLPLICPSFDFFTSVYEPKLDLPVMRSVNKREEVMSSCIVVLVNWISMFTRDKISNNRIFMNIEDDLSDQTSFLTNAKFIGYMQPHLIKDVLYSTRDNIDFVHEVYRQAFLLHYNTKSQIGAIRTAIATYKEWMSGTPPPFLLEPEENCNAGGHDTVPRNQRLRTDSYLGAITKENLLIRAGSQNVLQVFITNTANVFMIQTTHSNVVLHTKTRGTTPLDEQTDVCKSVLNIYRTMVMNTKMDAKTWEQLLLVLLQITAVILSQAPPNSKRNNLGGRLAQPVFQTLIVTWIRAHTNVPVDPTLWSKFLNVLSSLTHREELIIEWNKTMQTLTRVMARQVFNLNLQDLPLDRLAEQKGKRRRGIIAHQSSDNRDNSVVTVDIKTALNDDQNGLSEECSTIENQRTISTIVTLNRSHSEGSLASHRRSRSRKRMKNATKIPTLPSNVEHSLNKLLSTPPSSSACVANGCPHIGSDRPNGIRRALSLDSFRWNPLDESPRESRTPSPTVSNGMESGSIKDTIQIDMLTGDSSSIDTQDDSNIASADRRSILMGGSARGWLPDVAAVMWKRMLGALGDVNKILNPKLHAQVFKHLVDITDSLIKIRQNQGISNDNQSTPSPPTLVPPIGIFSAWCYGALSLDKQYRDGKLWALQMMCSIAKHGPPLSNDQLPLFYHVLHQALTGEDRAMAYTVLKYLDGPRFLSLLLPGHSLLLLDLVHASTVILTSIETNEVPRAEVTSLMSSMLCLPRTSLTKQFLQPSEPHITLVDCPDIQEHVLNVILRCARREPTSKARCIAISALAQWILQTLGQVHSIQKNFHQTVTYEGQKVSPTKPIQRNPRIKEAIQVILQAIQFKHRTIARVAAEALKLCADKGKEIAEIDLLPQLIIKSICIALEIQNVTHPKDNDKNVLSALLLCLGEFCMSIPTKILLQTSPNDSSGNLILIVLKILHQIGTGVQTDRIKLFTPDEDFDMTILVDDVKLPVSTEPNFQTAESTHQCINAIRLCARSVAMHLFTNLGHFPMGIGASRLSSIVDEHDDMMLSASQEQSSMARETVDFTSQVLNASNLQMFSLNSCLVASLIELSALKLPGGGITAGLVTVDRQVRVLLRDLNGKACWDASILYREPKIQITNIDNIDEKHELKIDNYQDSKYFMDKAQINSLHHQYGGTRNFMACASLDPLTSTIGMPLNQRQHTLRHRPPNQLPIAKDLAPDLDQLDDLLQYIGYTSPECLEECNTFLNAASVTPLGTNVEAQTISTILNQKSMEQDFRAVQNSQNLNAPIYYNKCNYNNNSIRSTNETQFHYCKLLFSQLGLAGWERRKRTHLLIRTDKLLRELRNLDIQRCRETHKVAVIYVAPGQEDKNSIFRNSCGSSTYEMFVSALGWEVELETHNGFLGGLPRQGCGLTSPYYATPFLEVIYHVATRMPYDNSEAVLNKTRHLGNDEVHIVWSEHHRDYRRDILPTEFCDVLIVIYPLKSGLFRVTVNRKPEVPWFGPLADESIVGGACLANLVRATAINAGRAKRSSLPFYQQFYEERKRSLDTIATRHKDSNTFEDFASRVYSPITLGNNIPVNPNSSLASAIIDNSYRNPSKKWGQPPTEATKLTTRDIPNQILSVGNIDHPSPRPHRKLHPFKSVPKKHSQGNDTYA